MWRKGRQKSKGSSSQIAAGEAIVRRRFGMISNSFSRRVVHCTMAEEWLDRLEGGLRKCMP